MAAHDIILIGASAGGFEAIQKVTRELAPDLPAAVFVTLHIFDRIESILPGLMNRNGHLLAAQAQDGEPIRAGRIYIAPPDFHLRLEPGRIQLSHGPRENMQRPSINAMFRSAAAAYRERVAGVLLTGMLDDGSAGLWEIQQHHGVTIVQDPEEASFRSMPENAIRGLNVQYIVRLAEMAPLLWRLSMADSNSLAPGEPVPPLEETSAQACPECGGAMTEVRMGGLREYRCHIGHRMGLQTMIAQKGSTVEKAIESALAQSEELMELLEIALKEGTVGSPEALREEIARRRKEQETLRGLTRQKMAAD